VLDLLSAITLLVLLAPLMLALALAVRVTSPGPAIFKQRRAGRDGKPFLCYKFRTMRLDVDPFGPSPKSHADKRLTQVGRFLREYSLDELPQLFNIILGDMSLVGPRPLYVSQIPEWNARQMKRLRVKPGLTGLAQVSGRGRLTREEKLELDVRYVDAASVWLDGRIILTTIRQVLGRKGVYEERYSSTQRTRGDRSSRPPTSRP
jgi:lipopolysaccharide/colanic/teichoic acid biosynthesis glycosyltransferase